MTVSRDSLDDLVDRVRGALGHDGAMPQRLATPDMPERASAAQQAISGTARLMVLRYVLSNPGCTRSEIVRDTAVHTSSARVALSDLEQLDYVRAAGEGPRQGRTIRYTADRGVLTDDLTQLFAWLLR